MRPRYVVGIDVGGTKMTLAMADDRARLVAHVRTRGHNVALEGVEATADAVAALLEYARARAPRGALAAVVVGAAGAANPELAQGLERALSRRIGAGRVQVGNDVALLTEIVAEGQNAIVLSVGTGAVAFVRTRRGVVHRIDGWGPLAGDRGSGHDIGARALEAALAGYDGRARRPAFGRAVLRAVGLHKPERDIAAFYAKPPGQRELAALAPLVVSAARRGDAVARGIVAGAAEALETTVRAAQRRAGSGSTALFVTGGLGRTCPELLGSVIAFARHQGIDLLDAPAAEAASLTVGFRLAGIALAAPALAELTARLEREARAQSPSAASRRRRLARTEEDNPATLRFSHEPPHTMVELMNAEDRCVAPAVGAIAPDLARAVRLIEARMRKGGRLVYVGAGTSGRLGVLDASEIPPTFGQKPGRVVGVIAGGDKALTHAVEGAEDDAADGARQMRRLRVTAQDTVVGLSVSGGAPFVLGAVAEARRRRALTLAITCNPDSALASAVRLALVVDVGPEVITGSSRLKAGTAQKMILNLLSTCVMARLGFVTGHLMTRVVPSNAKLRDRAVRVVAAVLGIAEADARVRLEGANWKLERVLTGKTSRQR